jgi:hypothetical protein
MAHTIHDALAVSKMPLTAAPAGQPPAIDLDTAQIDQILDAKGANNGGVYAVNIPRRDPITEQGMEGGCADHGRRDRYQFPTVQRRQSGDHGQLCLDRLRSPDVVRALRSNGIAVTAIPRIFFLHFWANDDAFKACQRRACCSRQNRKR